jgi:hypothetical protein
MDISKVKLSNGTTLDIKDATLRNKVGAVNGIATLGGDGKLTSS